MTNENPTFPYLTLFCKNRIFCYLKLPMYKKPFRRLSGGQVSAVRFERSSSTSFWRSCQNLFYHKQNSVCLIFGHFSSLLECEARVHYFRRNCFSRFILRWNLFFVETHVKSFVRISCPKKKVTVCSPNKGTFPSSGSKLGNLSHKGIPKFPSFQGENCYR